MVCTECSTFFASQLGAAGWGKVGTLLDASNGSDVEHPAMERVVLGLDGGELADACVQLKENSERLLAVRRLALSGQATEFDQERALLEGRQQTLLEKIAKLRAAEVVIERPNPDAGSPVTFEWGYTRHEKHGGRGRPSVLPDGLTLHVLGGQLLEWLEHLQRVAPDGRWVVHIQRSSMQETSNGSVSGFGTETAWMRRLAREAANHYLYGVDGQPKYRQQDQADHVFRAGKNGIETLGAAPARFDRTRYWDRDKKAIARRLIGQVLGEEDRALEARLDRWRQSGGLAGFRNRGGLG